MSQEFHATYDHGVLRLDQPLALPDQEKVTGIVFSANESLAQTLPINDEEFLLELDGLSLDVPVLPPDFSRADIYSDHD
jgi:hypothetical protein